MGFGLNSLVIFGCVVILVNAAAVDNSVYTETARISSSDELISSIVDNCFNGDTMHCLKEKVLTYLDTLVGINEQRGRSFDEKNIDKVIFTRLGRVLQTHEFKVQLPETFFQGVTVSYRSDRGLDFELPKEEGRGHLLKKKLLFPVLLLLKLKMKALMPIFVALIGIKAIKALILSKLAIKLVLGFLIYNLIQKLKMGGMKMSMMPMMPAAAEPMNAYGVPEPTTPPTSSSYSAASSWEPNSGPYSRWDTSGSAQNLAYSAYYPSSSSSSSSYSSPGSSGSSSASSPSSSSTYSSYTS